MPHPVGGAMGVTCYVSEEVTNPPPSERVTNQRNPRDLRTTFNQRDGGQEQQSIIERQW